VDASTVCKWRRVLAVPKSNTGSWRLYANGMRQSITPAMRAAAGKRPWTPKEDALLGTMIDREAARRLVSRQSSIDG
jgi:hypothetical protein